MNKNIVKTIGIFAALLAIVAFFSKTIYEYNLPAVTVGFAEAGTIRHSVAARGKIEVYGTKEIIAEKEGLLNLSVEENQNISAGDLLYTIETDMEQLEKSLKELEYTRSTLLVQISKLNSDIAHERSLENSNDTTDPLDLDSLEYEIEKALSEIEKAEKDLKDTQTLYESGAIPKVQLDEADEEVESAKRKHDEAITARDKAISNYNKELSQKERDSVQNAANREKNITDLNFQLRQTQIQVDYINEQIDELNEQLLQGGKFEFFAEYDGVVTAIYDGIKNGRYIYKNSDLMAIQPVETEYVAVFTLSNDVDYVEVGTTATLGIKSKNARNIEGTVERIRTNEEDFTVYVAFDYEGLKGGENVDAKFEKTSEKYDYILPNSAIREDQNMTFILYLEAEKNSYGWDYVARQKYVGIVEEGPSHTAIMMGSDGAKNSIILNSNMPIQEGSKVKIIK